MLWVGDGGWPTAFKCQPKALWFWGLGLKGLGPGLDNNNPGGETY